MEVHSSGSVIKNYAPTLLLLAGVIVGGACGAVFGQKASVVGPVGEIFLNLIFVLVVPLVFFSISSSVYRLAGEKSLGRVFAKVVAVFLLMSLVAGLLAYVATLIYSPLGDSADKASLLEKLPPRTESAGLGAGEAIAGALTVPDFLQLFSRNHLLPLIVFSALMGWAMSRAGESGRAVARFACAGMDVTMKMMDAIMKFAPIGLGCYFADAVGGIGSMLAGGYLRCVILYLVLTVLVFFVVNPLYVLLVRGLSGVRDFWKCVIPPSVTALATSSSAAAMPGNIEASCKFGVSDSVARSVIPLGTNIHKDGSVMTSVLKIVFLCALFSQDFTSFGQAAGIIGLAVVAALVTGAVPSGGATGELIICSLMGFSPEMAGIIIIAGTLMDMPATLINSSSNLVAAILVDSPLRGRRKRAR